VTATFTLPWPPSSLSPNGQHGHWAAKTRAKKSYRDACYVAVLAQKAKCPSARGLDLELVFVPPDRRRYDRDNLVARMKAGLDGLAAAWGVNDWKFVRVSAEIAETVAPARGAAEVRVTVREHARAPIIIDRDADGLPARLHL